MNLRIKKLAITIPLTGLATIAMLPFFWLACATIKRSSDLFTYTLLPWHDLSSLTLEHFRSLFKNQPFGSWLLNSIFLTSLQTTLLVLFSSLGGFALAKYQFAGKRLLMLLMMITLILPASLLVPSLYELMSRFHWVDSYAALIVPGAVSVFGMFLFRQSMLHVPDELLHAGRIDGCSELRLWWEIALPIVRPMIGAFTLMSFIGVWNGYLWPQVILQNESKYTLPIGLANMVGQPDMQSDYSVLMCGTLLSLLPVIALFIALQKDFVAGLSSGAVKG